MRRRWLLPHFPLFKRSVLWHTSCVYVYSKELPRMEQQEPAFFIDPTLYEGRPEDAAGLQSVELAAYDLLDSLGIPYHRMRHDAAMTIADCEKIDGILGTAMCKNLLLCNAQKTAFYLLMLPGEKVFKTKDLSKQIGSSRLSFAPGEYMVELLNIRPGSLTVLGLMNDKENRVKLLIDREVTGKPFIGCHPCVNTASLRVPTEQILNVFLPAVHHEPTFVTL